MSFTRAHDLTGILDDMRRHGDVEAADRLARDMIASAFAYMRIHKGARECARIADGLLTDFIDDVLGQPRKAK